MNININNKNGKEFGTKYYEKKEEIKKWV